MVKFNTPFDRDLSPTVRYETVDPTVLVDETGYISLSDLFERLSRGEPLRSADNSSRLSYDFDSDSSDTDIEDSTVDPMHSDDFDLSDVDRVQASLQAAARKRSKAKSAAASSGVGPAKSIDGSVPPV